MSANALYDHVRETSGVAFVVGLTGGSIGYLCARMCTVTTKAPWMLSGSVQGVVAIVSIGVLTRLTAHLSNNKKRVLTAMCIGASTLSGYGVCYLSGNAISLAVAVGLTVAHLALFALPMGLGYVFLHEGF